MELWCTLTAMTLSRSRSAHTSTATCMWPPFLWLTFCAALMFKPGKHYIPRYCRAMYLIAYEDRMASTHAVHSVAAIRLSATRGGTSARIHKHEACGSAKAPYAHLPCMHCMLGAGPSSRRPVSASVRTECQLVRLHDGRLLVRQCLRANTRKLHFSLWVLYVSSLKRVKLQM